MLIVLVILFLGSLFFIGYTRNQEIKPVLSATISRDCAPWDGAAFTITVPMSDSAILDISIWQSPDIRRPISFSFPDETQQIGNTSLLPQFGEPDQLTGQVWLNNVSEGMPVEGRFSLTSESGAQLEAKFVAQWDDQIVYCG
jgi:hypothetical protein